MSERCPNLTHYDYVCFMFKGIHDVGFAMPFLAYVWMDRWMDAWMDGWIDGFTSAASGGVHSSYLF